MKPLHELTQIGRGRRLRPIAVQILAEYGIVPTKMKQLTDASNTIFRVSRNLDTDCVLRMTAPKSCHGVDETRSEISWLRAISRDTTLGVPAPMARLDGTYVTEAAIPGEPDSMSCAVYSWVPGVMLDDCLTNDNVQRLGVLMARLHNHAAGFAPPDWFHIRTYSSVFPDAVEGFARLEPIVLFNEGTDAPLTDTQRRVYQRAHDRIADELKMLMNNGRPLRVIHGDLHTWNVKVDRKQLYALDFEDMVWGHPIQDIATTLSCFRWDDDYANRVAAFRAGYLSVSPWPEDHDGQLETLIMGRAIMLANYVAVSEDSEDRTLAPEYLTRVEGILRAYLEADS
jgi:Ser/Thr protein kinase RdoA (MazF antagonist)